MERVFEGTGPVFEAANAAFHLMFESVNVSKVRSIARHWLVDEYDLSAEESANIVNKVKNAVFDPLAAPGTNTETDPTFKKYIHLLPDVVKYVVQGEIYQLNGDLDSQQARFRLLRLGEALRDYLGEHGDVPSLDEGTLYSLDNRLGGNMPEPQKSGYQAIPLENSEQLVKQLRSMGATDVSWCIKNPTAWKNYSNDGRNKFYMLYDETMRASDPLSIIGTFVSPRNTVVSAFNRPNTAVPTAKVRNILVGCGIISPDDGDDEECGNVVRLLNEGGYDIDSITDVCRRLDKGRTYSSHAVYYVECEGKANVICRDDSDYTTILPHWVDKTQVGVIEDRYVTAGPEIYSIEHPNDYHYYVPDGLAVEPEWADSRDIENAVFVTRDGRRVNILSLDDGTLLLDPHSNVEFMEAMYEYAWSLLVDTVNGFTVYTVQERGAMLEDCPAIRIPSNCSPMHVSKNGKFCAVKMAGPGDRDNYVFVDDRPLINRGFAYIDENGDGTWTLCDTLGKHDPYILFHCDTGELEEKQD